jgi:hypothetical protein
VDDPATQSRNNPPLVFKPREFLFGLFVAAIIVFAVTATRWYVRARTTSAVSSCHVHLKQLQGAKDTWALKHNKRPDDMPNWTDIIGPKAYIAQRPLCPQGGTYALGSVAQAPRCSIAEHVLP